MADFTATPGGGGYPADSYPEYGTAAPTNKLTTLTNIAGALISLTLILGIGVWGYKLLVRDVSGIPVVHAASGDMRVRPQDPGGLAAQHQGLSVNAVAAVGTAAKPADRLQLAPKPVDLTDEDIVQPAALVATAPQAQVAVPDVAAALQSGNVDELVAQLTAGVAPLTDLNVETQEVVASVTETVVAEVKAAEAKVAAVLDAPGVRSSARPKKRPAQRPVVLASAQDVSASGGVQDVDAATLPAGTRLAQLGAFDSAEVAKEQWVQLQGRFGVYLEGKQRIVQKAKSGGRIFYRLRAHGFEDIADARRFCSALVAENADCIPVVTR